MLASDSLVNADDEYLLHSSIEKCFLMTKIGAIEFDERIFEALRDDQLVIFAGAGVSVGCPSNLPSYRKLACDIAQGTGFTPTEQLDRFLGQLHHKNIAVHDRAIQILSTVESSPNVLHRDLLRLFKTADKVKLVTTNFDLHFETAASALFDASPDVYRAPALPLGYDFSGIVHLHGALPRARDLVLTDVDFGRAYLTEGWARRFLVDLFRRYTVLFVGYSHNDVVLTYLARALPANSVAGRFALTDEDGSWDLLGIKPIHFKKGTDSDLFQELYDGMGRLADLAKRGALDWQSRLIELGSRIPPTDEDAISEVEQALREVHTTRLLLNVARDPRWLNWLNDRKYLEPIFSSADLDERDALLAEWVAKNFTIEHPDVMFEILAGHDLRMNPALWWSIGHQLGLTRDTPVRVPALKRWITILLTSAPSHPDHHVFMWLAERCAGQGCVELTLATFKAMSEYRLIVKSGFSWPGADETERRRLEVTCSIRADHWSLNEIWAKHLKPYLAKIAEPLLSGLALSFERMHDDLTAWDKASSDWDPTSYHRSAIEPHDQDQYPDAIDVLIDSARDAIEWLAANSPALLDAWIEKLVNSHAPLLRRLAIHAITVHTQKSPEDRLTWLIDRVGLHGPSEHHEIHRAVALSYAVADESARKAIIDVILDHKLQASGDSPAEERTVRSHFDWTSWLVQVKPDCALAGAVVAQIKEQHPDWRLSDHPDLTHWIGSADWVGSESPWSVEQLLASEPSECLDDLLSFRGNRFDGPSRDGLLANIRDACKQRSIWAFALGRALAERAHWSSDLWPVLIRGLQESELPAEDWRDLLALASNPDLQALHAYDIANLLYALVRDGGKTFVLDLLNQANTVALSMWQALDIPDQSDEFDNWLSLAINRPAGIIVEFWLGGLSIFLRGKTGAERVMPEDYRNWFTLLVHAENAKGGMGRSLLSSQTAFLYSLDEVWTRQHVIPLFSHSDPKKFAQAWDGFLTWGRLYPALVDELLPAFIAAIPRLDAEFGDRRSRFIEFYTALAVFHVSDPTEHLLPELFKHGSLDDRLAFNSYVCYFLRQMQQGAKKQIWCGWLRRYWQNRLQGVLGALDEAEIRKMLDWLPHLGESFSDAVALTVRAPLIRLEHSHVLFELRDSELVTRFPIETAELLIYLSNCAVGYHAADLASIDARLPPIPTKLRNRIDESFTRAGVLREKN